jgi:hypothetical protein
MNIPVRKLSISVQLTNPEEHEGGELYLYDDDKGTVMDKTQGNINNISILCITRGYASN